MSLIIPQNLQGNKPGVFSGFAGLTKASQPKNNGSNGSDSIGSKKLFSFGGASASNGTEEEKESEEEDSQYLQSLKSLNESVLNWIKQHVEKNAYISLTPIFKDYEAYMEKIEAKKSSSSYSSNKTDGNEGASGDPQNTFGSLKKEGNKDKKDDNVGNASKESAKPLAFGASSVQESETKNLFSFGSSTSSSTNGKSSFILSSVFVSFIESKYLFLKLVKMLIIIKNLYMYFFNRSIIYTVQSV